MSRPCHAGAIRRTIDRMALRQFQCEREGTLFYYQTDLVGSVSGIVSFCPVCGSKRVDETGRRYPNLNETKHVKAKRTSRRSR